ncbi:acyltransferase family protein [Methylovorus sp. SPW-M1]
MKINWIDILKGIGILFVVIGHMTPKDIFLTDFIFLFHMPLFFFISGYLFKPTTDLKGYARKKAIHLLLPYLTFLCVIYILPTVINLIYENRHYFGTFKEITTGVLLGGRALRGIESVFWFVTCLYATQLLVNWLLIKLPKLANYLCAGMLCISYVNAYFHDIWLPWNINVVLAAAPIFFIGHVYKRIPNKIPYEWTAFIVAGAAISLLLAGFDNTYDMKAAQYGLPFITFLSAIAMIVVLIKIATWLEHINYVRELFIQIGQASIIIMFLHQLVLIKSKIYLGENHEAVRFSLAIIITMAAYYLLKRIALSRALFLGSEQDFQMIMFKIRRAITKQ